ncbi:MAG: hypothetical protein IT328_00130 [Caldilineaceae bacterium]|nr:hypothetical protein [Caldilineaceae bacterium]
MIRGSLRPYYVMGSLIVVLLVVTAGAGVLHNDMYRPFLGESIVAFQFFQDLVSLAFAPLLAAAMYWTSHGSRRGFVLWTGVLVFVAYYYSFYGFDFVYTLYFPLYLALMGLSIYSLIGLLTNVDAEVFRAGVAERMPVRLVAGVLGMTALFVPIWLSMIVQGIRTQQPQATDLALVLDLPYLIPACVFAAVQIWQRRSIGYLLGGPLLFKAAISGVLLTGGEMLKMQRGLPPALDQLAMYLFLAVVGLTGLVLYLRHLDASQPVEMAQPSVKSSPVLK